MLLRKSHILGPWGRRGVRRYAAVAYRTFQSEVIYMLPYDSDFDYRREYIDRWNTGVHRAKIWMIVLGIVLVLAGVLSAMAPYSLYAFMQMAVGIALLFHGVGQVASYFGTPEFFRSSTLAVSGVLNALLGVLFLTLPAYLTASTLVFLLAFLFIVTGFERLTFARQMKYFQLPCAGAGTVTGVINIVLGVVFILMPMFSSIVLTYVIAAYLIVAGITLIIEAFTLKRIER